MQRSIRLPFATLVLVLVAVGPAAAQVTVFDGTFSRGTGQPAIVHSGFAAVEGTGTISVFNGGIDDGAGRRVSDATIRLNGTVVFDERDFNQQVAYLEAEVDLLALNDLEVFLEGSPGGKVTIRVVWPPLEIAEFFERLAELYETSLPSEAELTAWFDQNVAPDFLQDGTDRGEMLLQWLAGGGPAPGMTFSPVVTGPLDVTGTVYAKGYRINLGYMVGGSSGSLDTAIVFDGTRWLWYGDQEWVQPSLNSHMSKTVWFNGSTVLETGLAMTLSDESNCFAYRHGVRSAIVTGPGLPAAGIKLYHMYPLPYLRLYPYDPMNAEGKWLLPLSDAAIVAIPDDAEYTFRLYSQPAGEVTLADTPLTTLRVTNPKPPLLNTQLTSAFPTLLAPTTHNSSELNIGGLINVVWTNPSDTTPVRYASFGLTTDSVSFAGVSSEITPGATSITLDTSAYPRTDGWRGASLFLGGVDEFGRGYGFMWIINPWM
jgi:hypothetical protein